VNELVSLDALTVKLRGLLRKSGANGERVAEAARAIIGHADLVVHVSNLPKRRPRCVNLFENAAGELIAAPPESRKVFHAAKRALEQARGKLIRFQDTGLYAKVYRKRHDALLADLIGDLDKAEGLSASRDVGGVNPLGFQFFAAVAIEWKHASGKFPPTSPAAGLVHDILVQLVTAVGAKDNEGATPLKGISAETFQDAVAEVRCLWRQTDSVGEPAPSPNVAYELKRPTRKRQKRRLR
jgi:hypothetical protein